MKKDNNDNYEEFRPFPLYVILCSGIIIILIGLLLLVSNRSAAGITNPGKYGSGGGQPIFITGEGAIFIGVLMSLFPAYQLIKRKKKK